MKKFLFIFAASIFLTMSADAQIKYFKMYKLAGADYAAGSIEGQGTLGLETWTVGTLGTWTCLGPDPWRKYMLTVAASNIVGSKAYIYFPGMTSKGGEDLVFSYGKGLNSSATYPNGYVFPTTAMKFYVTDVANPGRKSSLNMSQWTEIGTLPINWVKETPWTEVEFSIPSTFNNKNILNFLMEVELKETVVENVYVTTYGLYYKGYGTLLSGVNSVNENPLVLTNGILQGLQGNERVTVFNAAGKEVKSLVADAKSIDLNVSAFTKGLYVVKADGCQPLKFVVN